MSQIWYILGTRDSQTVTIATVHELEYHGEWMAEEYVSCSVKSPEPIDFRFGDHLTYRGRTYYINYDPNVLKKARLNTYGEGFTYDNVKFYASSEELKSKGFRDVVLYDNNIAYSMQAKFSFYAKDVEDLADRIQANLDRISTGEWRVLTPNESRCAQRVEDMEDWDEYYTGSEDTGEGEVSISVDNITCWEALSYAYSKFGLKYYVSDTTIVIGGKDVDASHIFTYGKGNGLYEVERTSDDEQEIVTKAFAYGSEKNMPLNYYANLNRQFYADVTATSSDGYYYIFDISENYKYFTTKDSTGEHFVTRIDEDGSPVLCYILAYDHSETVPSGGKAVCYLSTGHSLTVGQRVYFLQGINKNTWPQDHIVFDPNYPTLLSINRLMLPGFPDTSLKSWVEANMPDIADMYVFSEDPLDPWVRSLNYGSLGMWEGSANFDGSSLKEIFPTIENSDACHVTTGSTITDNGYLDESADHAFAIGVTASDLDWEDALANATDTVYVEMKSGYCTGRSFQVKKAKLADDGSEWTLTLEREPDQDLGRYFPYLDNTISNYCQILEDDTFVVTGIQLPQSYVEAAAEKLLIAACGWLDKRDHVRYTYLPKIDEIYMARERDDSGEQSIYYRILAGMTLSFRDTDLGIDQSPYIDQLTIKENGNNGIPTFDVVLRDEKDRGTLEAMADDISDLKGAQRPIERHTSSTEYIKEYKMGFFDGGGYPYGDYVTARRNSVNIYILPKIYYGEDDITSKVDSWRWDRETKSGGKVEGWFSTQGVTITNEDMPSAWDYDNPAIFTCIATINSLDIEISKQFTI